MYVYYLIDFPGEKSSYHEFIKYGKVFTILSLMALKMSTPACATEIWNDKYSNERHTQCEEIRFV
jgi:hypothetical protein